MSFSNVTYLIELDDQNPVLVGQHADQVDQQALKELAMRKFVEALVFIDWQ